MTDPMTPQRGVPHELQEITDAAGGKIDWVAALPDGSGAATMSFPLPADHWLTRDGHNVPPMPFRMGNTPMRREWAAKINAAGRYAIRGATMNGKEQDFDPDAMLQNLCVGMLGYWTEDGTSNSCGDPYDNPDPIPPRLDAAPAAAPAAPAPSECRGYAHLGIGAYVINHSRAGTEPELVISLATEEEKRGRVVGDTRDNQPDAVLQPDAMVVRLRFENEVGFDALLHQLKLLREVHFPDPDDGRYHGFPPQDAAPAPDADGLRALLRRGRSMIVEVAADLATGKWLLSEFREDHEGMVTRATMRKIRGQNEAMRRQAIKLRAAFDALAPLFDTVEQQARELAAKDAMARAVDSVFAAWLDNDEPAIAAALGRLFAARDGVPDTADARTIAELSGATDRLIDRAERAERDLSAARAAIAAADERHSAIAQCKKERDEHDSEVAARAKGDDE